MERTFSHILLIYLVLSGVTAPPHPAAGASLAEEEFGGAFAENDHRGTFPEAPAALFEAWLRFHESEWCQDLDAHFLFHPDGMEIWCRIREEKPYEKLLELVKPLRENYSVALYPTHPPTKKRTPEDKDPPPSLWNNSQVRDYFRDPFDRRFSGIRARPGQGVDGEADYFMKQRILMFADQLLEANLRVRQLASHLPELASAGFSDRLDPALRSQAVTVCVQHASEVSKHLDRVIDGVDRALPRGTKRFAPSDRVTLSGRLTPHESALQLSRSAWTISRRVHLFVYPQHHTVGLVDLREPSLLESLKTLRRMVEEFQAVLRK